MLTCRSFPALFEDDHGTTNHATLLPTSISVVRTPAPGNIRPRPTLHLALWASASKGARNLLEPVNGIPPANRWADRTKEPVGRTIPLTLIHQSAQLGHDAPPCHPGSQQRPKFNHWPRPEPRAQRARTYSNP